MRRHCDRADRHDGEIGNQPLEPILRKNADAIAGSYAMIH